MEVFAFLDTLTKYNTPEVNSQNTMSEIKSGSIDEFTGCGGFP
jgi:hypothetical protein